MIFRLNIDDFRNNKIECIDIGYAVCEKFDRKTGCVICTLVVIIVHIVAKNCIGKFSLNLQFSIPARPDLEAIV
jgi:hypothetical protein